MDEILIEDKKYVSSKRAAKMTGYAKDYVGQLCREGRVPARLVGRSWYVLESAIQDHRFGTTVIEPKPAPLARETHPTWESPRYEASTSEILPSINRLQHTETPPENLQESWKAWFDHVGNIEPAVVGMPPENIEEKEEQYEEPQDVQIPIHTIYQLPPEELLPHRARIESATDEQEYQLEVKVKRGRGLSRGAIRTIQTTGALLALIMVTVAFIGSGYLDKYIISNSPVSILAGVGFYNR